MKKYLIIALLFIPVMSMAASSVKKFGGVVPVASSGVKPSVAAKVTPAKVANTPMGANMARIGSVKLKPATTGTATGDTTGASSSRFPMIPSLKVYNSAAALKPATVVNNGSSASIAEIDELERRVSNIENQAPRDSSHIVTNVSTLVDHDDTINVGAPWVDTVVSGRTANPPEGRAWIWVEE